MKRSHAIRKCLKKTRRDFEERQQTTVPRSDYPMLEMGLDVEEKGKNQDSQKGTCEYGISLVALFAN